MLQLLTRKWWVVLLQGVLLILLGFYIFQHPAMVLTSVSIWVGLFIFLSGVFGIFSALGTDGSEHRGMLILWSVLTATFGFLLLTNVLVTMAILTMLFGIWMLAGGLRLTAAGWSLKNTNGIGWIVIIAGLFSLVAAFMVMFNIGAGAVGISMLLGIQVLLAGISLAVLSFVKKSIGGAVKEKIEGIKNS